MDGATSPFEGESAPPGVLPDYAKKAVPAEKLAELALLDPKRAKRCADFFFSPRAVSLSLRSTTFELICGFEIRILVALSCFEGVLLLN